MPAFEQGSSVTPAYLGDSLIWVVELYSASNTYPLSRHYTLAGEERSYFRHAGTALVNAITGRLVMVPAPSADALAAAWRARFPANIRAGSPDILESLQSTPTSPPGMPVPAGIPPTDAAFRTEVTRLYRRMKQALAAGDLPAFAIAYDSLGAIVGR
jgi:hypothetical protein